LIRGGKVEAVHDTGGSVFDLVEDAKGAIWASSRSGVYRVSGGRVERITGLEPPLQTSWNVLSVDSRGDLWVVDSMGLKMNKAGLIRKIIANGGGHGEILTALPRTDSEIMLGSSKGLFRWSRGEPGPRPVAGVRGPVVALLEDRDRTLWVGTWGYGIYRVIGDRVESWSGQAELPDEFIRKLFEDREGSLWIGMRSGGLARWTEGRIVPLGTAEGLAGNYSTTVAQDLEGALWLGTWRGGLYRLKDGRLEPRPTPLPALYLTIRAMAFDRRGHPWIGNWEGLFEYDGTRYLHHAATADSPIHEVSALHFDRSGALWVGTANHGLHIFPSGKPDSSGMRIAVESAQVTALLEDGHRRMWVGTDRGFGRVENRGGWRYERERLLKGESIESLFEDSLGRVWAASAGGVLAVLSAKGGFVLDERHGVPAHALYRVLEDNNGSYWISSPRGILEIRRRPLEDVLAGKRRKLEIIRYGREDGMRTIECHGLSQPSGSKDRYGNLWFPSAQGFVQVRPARLGALTPPAPRVEEVTVDSMPIRAKTDIVLDAGTRNLEIRSTAARLSHPHHVEFRYRLSPYDPEWVDAGNQRSARYNELPPGRLLFEVQARDPFGAWGAAAAVSITQQPRFYRSWWFLMLAGLATSSAVLGMYRWRLHSLRSRYSAVLDERNRIGREWHDTLVAGFSAISLQLEAALARLKEQPERSAEILDVTRRMVHHYRAEARRVIWDLRDSRPEGETLPQALEGAVRRVVENRGIEGVVRVQGEAVPLPAELELNVLRICQEAMSNAARHGGPTRIDVHLQYGSRELTAVVEDNGRGFDASDAQSEAIGHFGLTVMRERARRLGGKLEFRPRAGGGTVVETHVPLSRKGLA